MKKSLMLLILSGTLVLAASGNAFGASGVIKEGRTLVGLRGVFDELGFNVHWNADTETATLSDEHYTIAVPKGEETIEINGVKTALEVPQQIIDGSFYMPLRAVGDSIGADISWDDTTKTATIIYKEKEIKVNCGEVKPLAASQDSNTNDGIKLNFYQYTCTTNAEIDLETSKEVHMVYNDVISAIKSKDKEKVRKLFSEKVQGELTNFDLFFDEISRLLNDNVAVKNEHYVQFSKLSQSTSPVMPDLINGKDYIFSLLPLSESSYVIYSIIEYPQTQFILESVFTLENGTWKVQKLLLGVYSYNGMDAIDLANYAKKLSDEGHYVQAKIYALACKNMVGLDNMYQYKEKVQGNAIGLINNILNDKNEIFENIPPIQFKDYELQIIGFDLVTTQNQGVSPRVIYLTPTDFSDVKTLAEEANMIADKIDSIFTDFTNEFGVIAVTAYNEPPADPEKTYKNYTNVVEVGK